MYLKASQSIAGVIAPSKLPWELTDALRCFAKNARQYFNMLNIIFNMLNISF